VSAASEPNTYTSAPLSLGEPGAERALRICLRVFESLGDIAGADACRRALGVVVFSERQTSQGRLTRREQEVARLIAAGWTNRQIAQALQISPGTAGRHIANMFLKLGFHARAQVASWYASTESCIEPRPSGSLTAASECYKTRAGPR
jgi:DNA-binding CsgD family transcriptional regulator